MEVGYLSEVRYLGGKSRLAKAIVAQLPLSEVDEVWEPFMGGGSVTAELARQLHEGQRLIASDAFVPLIAMWFEVLSGWVPPSTVREEEHRAARSLPDLDPRKAFIGFGCSFCGTWFGGYARDAGRNYAEESRRNLLAISKALRDSCARMSIQFKSFFDVTPEPSGFNRLIYCDPPYAGTAGYPTGAFDHGRFWAYCRDWRRNGARVYVSEFSAPDFAKPIWGKERKIQVTRGKAKLVTKTEYLFEVQP